jgi:hypothetical protein
MEIKHTANEITDLNQPSCPRFIGLWCDLIMIQKATGRALAFQCTELTIQEVSPSVFRLPLIRGLFLLSQGIGSQLEVYSQRLGAFAVLHQPWRPVAARAPQATPFPAGFYIVDASIEAFGVKAERIRHGQ